MTGGAGKMKPKFTIYATVHWKTDKCFRAGTRVILGNWCWRDWSDNSEKDAAWSRPLGTASKKKSIIHKTGPACLEWTAPGPPQLRLRCQHWKVGEGWCADMGQHELKWWHLYMALWMQVFLLKYWVKGWLQVSWSLAGEREIFQRILKTNSRKNKKKGKVTQRVFKEEIKWKPRPGQVCSLTWIQ